MRRLSTNEVASADRYDWLQEMIGREYVKVAIRPPTDGNLFNEMTIYPWDELRLSAIRSNAIGIERLPGEPYRTDQDAFFVVLMLSGRYLLEQQGRSAILAPGDLALYDATQPHRIQCPQRFTKLIVSIPRALLRDRLAGPERCLAHRIPGRGGLGKVAADFMRSVIGQAGQLSPHEFQALATPALDLLAQALASAQAKAPVGYGSRSLSLQRIKAYIERHLADAELNAQAVARGVGLSVRYINDLFGDEGNSLMRHIWRRRLECCRRDLLDPAHAGHCLSQIAFHWGFNDMSHFSRTFKQRYGCAPRDYRRQSSEPHAALSPGCL